MSLSVSVVRTGTANLASVEAAFNRLGVQTRFVLTADEVAGSDRLILPGVGAFGAAMRNIDAANLTEALRERILAGRHTLAICLGIQLLCASSDESPEERGLDILPVSAKKLEAGEKLRLPQMGWNSVHASGALVRDGDYYFANSFALQGEVPGWDVSTFSYGANYVAAVQRGAVLGCQFHPELSGDLGMSLLEEWLAC